MDRNQRSELDWFWESNATTEAKKQYLISQNLMEAEEVETDVAVEEAETDVAETDAAEVDLEIFDGDETYSRKLHNVLRKKGMLSKEWDYHKWISKAQNDLKYRFKLHHLLNQRGLLSKQWNFNTWNEKLFGDELNQDEFIGPSPTPEEEQPFAPTPSGYIEVEGIPVDVQRELRNNKSIRGANEFENKIKAQQAAIENLLRGGSDAIPVNEDGSTNFEALQEKIDELESYFPKMLDAKNFDYSQEELDYAYEEINKRIQALTGKELTPDQIEIQEKMLEIQNKLSGKETTATGITSPTLLGASADETSHIMGGINTDAIAEQSEAEQQVVQQVFSELLAERAEKLKLRNEGKLDLSSEELFRIGAINPEVQDYVNSKMPDTTQFMVADELVSTINPVTNELYTQEEADEEENRLLQEAFSNTINKATEEDPRYKFAQQQTYNQIFKDAIEKTNELRDKYVDFEGNISKIDQGLMEEEFRKWFGEQYQEKMLANNSIKDLYQDYAVAARDSFGKIQHDFDKATYDSWLDDNVLREVDEVRAGKGDVLDTVIQKAVDIFGYLPRKLGSKLGITSDKPIDFQHWREATVGLGPSMKAMGNKFEIALQEGLELENRYEIYNSIKDSMNDGSNISILEGMLEEGFNPSDKVVFDKEQNKYVIDNINGVSIQDRIANSLNEDMSLGEATAVNKEIADYRKFWGKAFGGWWDDDDSLKDFYDKRKERYDNTVAHMTQDLDELADAEKWSSLIDQEELEESVVAQVISQAPHMVPNIVGGMMVAAGAVTGGGTAPIGLALIAAGSGYMGAQVYGDVFMEGTRRQMEEEYGAGGFTTEEYIEALQQEKYGDQLMPILAGAGTMMSEAAANYLGPKLAGLAGAELLKSTVGRTLMSIGFSKYMASIPAGLLTMPIDGAVEALTEGFQGYMAQVAENIMNLGDAGDMAGQSLSSAFTNNIDWDTIKKEARLGWRIGMFTGGVGVSVGGASFDTNASVSTQYNRRARIIATDYDMSDPTSDSYKTAEDAFRMMEEEVSANNLLTKDEKRSVIKNISAVREASMKTPKTVTGTNKGDLISLIKRKKELEEEIKRVNDKEISEASGTIEELNDVNNNIKNIIETARDTPSEWLTQNVVKNSIIDIEALFDNFKRPPKPPPSGEKIEITDTVEVEETGPTLQDIILKGYEVPGYDVQTVRNAADNLEAIDNRININEIRADQMFEEFRNEQVEQNQVDRSVFDENRDQAREAFETLQETSIVLENQLQDTRVREIADSDPPPPPPIGLREAVEGEAKATRQKEMTMKGARTLSDLAEKYQIAPTSVDNLELLRQYRKVGKEALKRWAAERGITINLGDPQVNTEVDSLLNKEFPSFIKNFDRNKAEASTYMANIVKRVGPEIAKEGARKGKQVSQDVLTEKGYDPIAEEQQDFDEAAREDTQREKVYSSSTEQVQDLDVARTIGIVKDELKKDILTAANQGKNVADTVSVIRENAKKHWFKELREDIGTFATEAYKAFVNSIDELFIKSIPAAVIKRRFGKLFGIKKISTTPTKQVGKSGKMSYFDKPVYSIPKITKEGIQEFKDYFLDNEKRQQSIYTVLVNDFALESISELTTDKDFMQKLETALADSNITAVEFMESLENLLDPRIKEDTSLDIVDDTTRQKAKEDDTKKEASSTPPPPPPSKIDKEAIEKNEARKKRLKEIRFKKDQENIWKGKAKEGIAAIVEQYYPGYLKLSKADKLIEQKKLFEKLVELGMSPDQIIRAGTLSPGYSYDSIMKRGEGRINYISDKKSFKNTDPRTQQGVAKGEIGVLKDITKDLNKIFKGPRNKDISATITGQAANNAADVKKVIDRNLKDYTEQRQGARDLFEIFRKLPKKLKGILIDVGFGNSQFTQNIFRQLSRLHGRMKKYVKGASITLEHVLQFGAEMQMIGELLRAPKAIFEAGVNWLINKNLYQIATSSKQQEKTYQADTIGKFSNQPIGVKWEAKWQLFPELREQWKKFLRGEIGVKELFDPLTRYFNEYFYENPNLLEIRDPNTGELATVAEVHGTVVPEAVTINGIKYSPEELMSIDLRKTTQNSARYPNVSKAQAYATMMVLQNKMDQAEAKAYLKTEIPVALKQDLANVTIQEYAPTLFEKICSSPCRVPKTSDQVKKTLVNSGKVKAEAQKITKKPKGLSAFDLDDTLALTKEKVLYTMLDGTKGELTAGEFAVQYETLLEQGVEFDFSNFENVDLSTPKGPLAGVALKRQAKYGSKDIYVVTARPGAAKQAIKTFLDSIGLNIPIDNIITLEDGSPQAKADWVISKAQEGYNDFYFADDSALNVDTVKQILDQIDVKSKVQQAIADKATRLDKEFNDQIEDVTGKETFKEYSDVRGRLEGKRKDKGLFKRFLKQFTITPSAEDFMGLMYDLIGKGKQGNKHMKWIKDNLIDVYNKAEQEILSAKVTLANDFAALKESFPSLRSTVKGNPLMQEIGVGPYTKSQAIRVYLWNKQGMEIPGMSKTDIGRLVKAVESDFELKQFADNLQLINKLEQYPAPEKNWLGGDITSDVLRGLDTTYRQELMTEFNENVDIIFSEKNKNKLRALYGNKWVEALEDSIRRMKAGSNRPVYVGGGARIVNEMLDWLNASVGAVMFLNVKSGLLQLISNVNFINWGDNNIYAAAKAFASKDYWPTVLKLMNSDYLVNRRDGLKINVNEAELADAGRKGGIKGAINYLLDKGFVITRIMDSLAIATGGATFYINRVKSLLNRVNPETGKTYTKTEAEAKAFDDFYAISEESQQSSNPAKISQQQASMAGRVILAFQNVTMQYTRMTKKAIRDLYNRRKTPGMTQRESDLSNISKIVYYTTVQNLVFNAMQQALFALAFDDEADEEEKKKAADILNGMADSLLFGLGFGGAIVSTVKNVLLKVLEEKEKKSPDYEEAVWEIFNISPVLDSKVRKLRTTAKTFSWNMEDIKRRGWSLDNPSYLAISQLISAVTNIPIDRVMRKMMNMRQAMDEETKTWQRIALVLGYSGWSLDLPYWGLESTIKREAEQIEKVKIQYKIDAKRLKSQGYTRIPLTGPKSGKPKGKLGVDYIQVERPTGMIEYWLIPKK